MKYLLILLACFALALPAEASILRRQALRVVLCFVPFDKLRTEIKIRIWQNETDDWYKRNEKKEAAGEQRI